MNVIFRFEDVQIPVGLNDITVGVLMCVQLVSWSKVNQDENNSSSSSNFYTQQQVKKRKPARKPVLLTALSVCVGVCMCACMCLFCVRQERGVLNCRFFLKKTVFLVYLSDCFPVRQNRRSKQTSS